MGTITPQQVVLVPAFSSIFLLLLGPGCFGVSVIYPDGFEYDHRKSPVDLHVISNTARRREGTGIDIITRQYGVPESMTVEILDDETKRYTHRDLRWSGIVVAVGIPIPLLIPTGFETYSFTFKNDLLVEERVSYTRDLSCGVGMDPVPMLHRSLFKVGCGSYAYRKRWPVAEDPNFVLKKVKGGAAHSPLEENQQN